MGPRSHKVGGWPGVWREPWGSRAMEGGWSGGRAEQAERAERAERAGMHLKSFDRVYRHRATGTMGHGAGALGPRMGEKMGPWSHCWPWGQEPWVHGGHRGRRDGAMRREGRSKRRAGMHWGPLWGQEPWVPLMSSDKVI